MKRRQEIILAALAPAKGSPHSPVQVQKLLFLIDREISDLLGGPFFNFQPYNYGPFDQAVYRELEDLAAKGLVRISFERNWRNYELTPEGQEVADKVFKDLPQTARNYIKDASKFVRSLSFTQLVLAIYKAYPEMKENSVFQK